MKAILPILVAGVCAAFSSGDSQAQEPASPKRVVAQADGARPGKVDPRRAQAKVDPRRGAAVLANALRGSNSQPTVDPRRGEAAKAAVRAWREARQQELALRAARQAKKLGKKGG